MTHFTTSAIASQDLRQEIAEPTIARVAEELGRRLVLRDLTIP
jgi:hypothetical protein